MKTIQSDGIRAFITATVVLWISTFSPVDLSAQDNKPAFKIGHIDFFGYDGLDLQTVRDHLPVRVGDSVTDRSKAIVQKAVQDATGRAATDIAGVCCDSANRLMIFVGLGGASSRPLSTAAVPHGSDHLDPIALRLNQQMGEALEKAAERGASSEDDSHGYALSVDPDVRALQLKVRAYALYREAELERVLRNSGDAKQRQISAEMLGYTRRSPAQIQALSYAVSDSDKTVRNNAVRALLVLSSAKNAEPLKIDPKPFIALLFSGTWTDRNKGSALLMNLTKQRDPALLDELRADAMKPLIEGARWSSSGHADSFLMILGRIGGLPEERIAALIEAGDKEKIILAAEKHH